MRDRAIQGLPLRHRSGARREPGQCPPVRPDQPRDPGPSLRHAPAQHRPRVVSPGRARAGRRSPTSTSAPGETLRRLAARGPLGAGRSRVDLSLLADLPRGRPRGDHSGFIALGEVSDYARGIVAAARRRTHAGPKRDRMSLLERTGADIGLLFMLVGDPDGRLRAATTGRGDAIAEATRSARRAPPALARHRCRRGPCRSRRSWPTPR